MGARKWEKRKIPVGAEHVIVGPHVAKGKPKGAQYDLRNPTGRGVGSGPSDMDLMWCAWGWLLASQWYSQQGMEPPSPEYIEAFAELHGLPVPVIGEFTTNKWEGA